MALEMGFVGTVLSVHLPIGFPGRLSSLKAWSFVLSLFPAQSCVWARSVLVASLLIYAVRRDGSGLCFAVLGVDWRQAGVRPPWRQLC